jgi:hypothetical protein
MSFNISPQNMGGDPSHRIDKVEHELNKIQREVDGMRRERIKDANGQIWETIARREAIEEMMAARFFVNLIAKGSGQYAVTVEEGYLIERNMLAGNDEDALIYHECVNRVKNGELMEFDIQVYQAVFVQALENEFGTLKGGDDITLFIGPKDEISKNTIPGIQAGVYLYKLAELEEFQGGTRLRFFCAGSNIFHKSGLTADILINSCPEDLDSEPIQLLRGSFTSGSLVSVDESVSARPYAQTVADIGIQNYCS